VTAERPQEAAVAAAQAAGEAAAAAHAAWCLSMQVSVSGSDVVVEVPQSIDDIAVTWPGGS
jgi:hypothetical protein